MGVNLRIVVFWVTLLLYLSNTHAYWWSRTTEPPSTDIIKTAFQERYLQEEQPTTAPPPSPLPAIPIQVPLRAQFAPAHVQNVQLVPCLCPVTQDDIDKSAENVYNMRSIMETYNRK